MITTLTCIICQRRPPLADSKTCSLCEAPHLPGIDVSGTVGQDDDWFETPYPCVDKCIEAVVAVIEEEHSRYRMKFDNPIRRVVCPSVGRGAFPIRLRAYYDEVDAPHPYIAGCDVVDRRLLLKDGFDPRRCGMDHFDVCDARTWVPGVGPWDLAIDNIPFDADTAIPIVQRYMQVARWCAFILPWDRLGGVDRWKPIMDSDECRPVWAFTISPRPWGDNTREVAMYLWRRDEQPAYTKSRSLPRWRV